MGCSSSKMCLYSPCAATRVISICLQCFSGRRSGTKAEVVWNGGNALDDKQLLPAKAGSRDLCNTVTRCGERAPCWVILVRAFSEGFEFCLFLPSTLWQGLCLVEAVSNCPVCVIMCICVCSALVAGHLEIVLFFLCVFFFYKIDNGFLNTETAAWFSLIHFSNTYLELQLIQNIIILRK